MRELVDAVLTPLLAARGGPEPLLRTLEAYFQEGGNASSSARSLHLSVRALTYRLEKIADLTGRDPADPAQRFELQTAVLGARLLGWPPAAPLRSLLAILGTSGPGRALTCWPPLPILGRKVGQIWPFFVIGLRGTGRQTEVTELKAPVPAFHLFGEFS